MSNGHWATDVRTGTRLLNAVGVGGIAMFTLGFGVWAVTAPLASAAIAPGVVAAAGQNQRVQHLEGGIIRAILVKEGDRVEAGQPLFELDPTAALAQHNRLLKQFVALSARAERLVAERDGLPALKFPRRQVDAAEAAGLASLLEEQAREFASRLERHRRELTILEQREQALREQVTGTTAQVESVDRQLTLVREEARRKKELLDKGLTNRSEYTDLLRTEADLVGQIGQLKASVLAAKTQIAEAREQIERARSQRVEQAASQLNDIRVQISDAEEQMMAAEAVLRRRIVTAPSNGMVVRIENNSPGSVVRAGDTLLELLPTGDDLIVEAQISPQDIDVVSIGRVATLRFTALNARTTPSVAATVSYVSADRLIDEVTGQPYYSARLRIADTLPPDISEEEIYPGMAVEAYVGTGERTFVAYLAKPILDSFSRAFREE